MAIPLVDGLAPMRTEPPALAVAVRVEDARIAAGNLDGVMESGDVPEPHVFHLFVRDGFADARDDAGERLAVAVLLDAPLTQVLGRTVGVTLDFLARHECDLVLLSGGEAMVFVVAIALRALEAGLRVIAYAILGVNETHDLLLAREVEAGHRDDDVTVLVAFEAWQRLSAKESLCPFDAAELVEHRLDGPEVEIRVFHDDLLPTVSRDSPHLIDEGTSMSCLEAGQPVLSAGANYTPSMPILSSNAEKMLDIAWVNLSGLCEEVLVFIMSLELKEPYVIWRIPEEKRAQHNWKRYRIAHRDYPEAHISTS